MQKSHGATRRLGSERKRMDRYNLSVVSLICIGRSQDTLNLANSDFEILAIILFQIGPLDASKNFAEMFWSKLQKVSDLLPVLRSDHRLHAAATFDCPVARLYAELSFEYGIALRGGIGAMRVDGWHVHNQHEKRIIPNALLRTAFTFSLLSSMSTSSQESEDPSGSRILNCTVCASRTACGSLLRVAEKSRFFPMFSLYPYLHRPETNY